MQRSKLKLLSVLAVLVILSASSSGFLVGRTVRLHEEGKFEQLHEIGEQLVDAGTIVHRGIEVVKRVILR
ncbi:hypothetical protein LEM8419_03016 [Neolewinella maritima]|uniref:Uncharacterized protein n=1 Tax=Neolewinella maritima TaxID=1383882 RepID=A0ABM9B4B5_9BACT|nr:hypothetical protein [Neolewinella maritima]CAH1002099.1 hypothetical protein LEM8419_03016 [Neolewinella maritima]